MTDFGLLLKSIGFSGGLDFLFIIIPSWRSSSSEQRACDLNGSTKRKETTPQESKPTTHPSKPKEKRQSTLKIKPSTPPSRVLSDISFSKVADCTAKEMPELRRMRVLYSAAAPAHVPNNASRQMRGILEHQVPGSTCVAVHMAPLHVNMSSALAISLAHGCTTHYKSRRAAHSSVVRKLLLTSGEEPSSLPLYLCVCGEWVAQCGDGWVLGCGVLARCG
ncbi:hypothetical protein BC567DRAFT_37005 [Phyllosticta citribraziliensis]